MLTLILLYVGFGAAIYWPSVYMFIDAGDRAKGEWYEWLAAWAVWSVCWPYRYAMDAWYWWRAKK